MHQLELRRTIFHLLYGPLLILLYDLGIFNLPLLGVLIVIGASTSYLIYRRRLGWVARVLAVFERPHHLENFPGRGILFFTIGATLSLALFEKSMAYAGIMVLSVGDSVANIVGRHWGRLKTWLNPEKSLEGTLLGILTAAPAAYWFFPAWPAVFAASAVAMFLELPRLRIFGFEIDDNLIIPIAASFTLSLFS